MANSKVYDAPTRFFHWTFAMLFFSAFLITKLLDDESDLYPYHMLLGLTAATAAVLRIFWGFAGTKYARFSSFELAPRAAIAYFKGLFKKTPSHHLGHNPASSWAAIIFLGLSLGLAGTGTLMALDIAKDSVEDVHELFADAFVFLVIGHVAGVFFHMFRHRDGLAFSMLHGRKSEIPGGVGIEKNHVAVAFVYLALIAGVFYSLNLNYDSNTRLLKIFGTELQLGSIEE